MLSYVYNLLSIYNSYFSLADSNFLQLSLNTEPSVFLESSQPLGDELGDLVRAVLGEDDLPVDLVVLELNLLQRNTSISQQ